MRVSYDILFYIIIVITVSYKLVFLSLILQLCNYLNYIIYLFYNLSFTASY